MNDPVIFACKSVAEGRAKAVEVSTSMVRLRGRMREVAQVVCEAAHDEIKFDDPEHGIVLVCPCCIAQVDGVPDLTALRVGQTMRKIDGQWLTTDGDA